MTQTEEKKSRNHTVKHFQWQVHQNNLVQSIEKYRDFLKKKQSSTVEKYANEGAQWTESIGFVLFNQGSHFEILHPTTCWTARFQGDYCLTKHKTDLTHCRYLKPLAENHLNKPNHEPMNMNFTRQLLASKVQL